MTDAVAFAIYAVPLGLIFAGYLSLRGRSAKRARAILDEATAAGLIEPPSLHPSIDPTTCLGCGSCASACPEGDVIGLIAGKAVMIEPTHCIGHGACADACPTGAISLVFGTERRGVDIPRVGPDFQTNVAGVYIAGELGGMGLIRNAIEQGRQAIEAIRENIPKTHGDLLDVVIVGAGPAGFAATLAAKAAGLKYVTLEQESLGGAVAHYPRGKLVMTAPAILPIVGKVNLKDPSKEALLDFWRSTAEKTGVDIRYEERVTGVKALGAGFEVATERGRHRTKTVLLAIGRRGTPRKLGVPGEDLPKVVYRMIDPAQYAGRRVVVVGGGDSALEAAAEIADQPGSHVVLSYRGEAFARARQRNRVRVDDDAAAGRINVLLNSEVVEIDQQHVAIKKGAVTKRGANDDVIVCAGGILPTEFLKSVGVEVETKFGTK
ncbi:MAG: NAD(P)-binding domain-containing protein [Pseudomonadota bacterium]